MCAGSMSLLAPSGPDTVEIDPYNPLSLMGTAVHAALAALVNTGVEPDMHEIASENGVSPDDEGELQMLYNQGARIWRDNLVKLFGDVMVERRFRHSFDCADGVLHLTGQIDVASVLIDRRGIINDWKSGYVEGDYLNQLRGYALLLALEHDLVEVDAIVTYLRTGNYRYYRFSTAKLLKWFSDRVVAGVLASMRTFSPGSCCDHCPALAVCKPRRLYLQTAVSDIVADSEEIKGGDLAEALADPERRAVVAPVLMNLWEKAKTVELTIDRLNKLVRESVAAHGPIVFPDGTRLQLTAFDRTSIDPAKGMPVLSRVLDPEALSGCLRVVKSDVEKAVKERAAPRQKGAAVMAVLKELEEAGALERSSHQKLERVDVPAATGPEIEAGAVANESEKS